MRRKQFLSLSLLLSASVETARRDEDERRRRNHRGNKVGGGGEGEGSPRSAPSLSREGQAEGKEEKRVVESLVYYADNKL